MKRSFYHILPSRTAYPSPPDTMGDSFDVFKLEPSSRYYLSNSDNPSLVIVQKPLNGDNNATCRRFLIVSWNTKNKLSFVPGHRITNWTMVTSKD
ncbi:unnamed protein product [Prunus brigantina]